MKKDSVKFDKIGSELNVDILEQDADIVESPPVLDKYSAIKDRLISIYAPSEEAEIRQLVRDRRPKAFAVASSHAEPLTRACAIYFDSFRSN